MPDHDKAELLNRLKIDRARSEPADSGRPIKWFVLIAVLAGVGFGFYFVARPAPDPAGPATPAASVRPAAQPAGAAVSAALPPTAAVRPASASTSVLDATGYVVARRRATVSAKVTGKVTDVYIEEGMAVEDGQLLARLDASVPSAQLALAESQLAAAQAALEELRVSIRQAELDLERTRGLARRNLASQADLDRDKLTVEGLIARLERARRETVVADRSAAVQRQMLDDMQIRAPFAGIVVAKAAQPGEMISPVSAGGGFTRTGICTIVDMGSLEVEVDVNEAYINRVYPGQPASVTLNAYPDDRYDAEVIAIIPTADRNKATVRVRVALLSRDERVLPDMGVRVAFLDGSTNASTPHLPATTLWQAPASLAATPLMAYDRSAS